MADDDKAIVPPPPRLTGDYAADAVIIREYLYAFYNAAVLQSGLLDPSYQSETAEIDPEKLPDPTDTTIAQSQLTANEAYQIAVKARDDLAKINPYLSVDLTLSGSNNQITYTFAEPLSTDDYIVLVQAKNFTGTPAASAFVVTKVERTKDSFTVTTAVAPGTSNSVSFDAYLVPTLNEQ